MIITRTPYRISFFGGGSDYKAYYENYGGSVLSASFNKYCYVTVRHYPQIFGFRGSKNQLTYSRIERFDSADEVEHPLVREMLKFLNTQNIQINYDADLPANSGLGSSSAFAVGLLKALYSLEGIKTEKRRLAEEAIYLEREMCREAGGIQDQIAVAYGGFNRISFSADGFEVNPVAVSMEKLDTLSRNLVLVFTGFQRYSNDIAGAQEKKIGLNIPRISEMVKLVSEGERILLSDGDIDDFGRLLDYTWQLKKSLSDGIATPQIDELYDTARAKGALGGKLLGAGGGGFLLLYIPPERREAVLSSFNRVACIPVRFENSGASVLYSNNEV